MGFLGRESQAEAQRAQRVTQWVRARTPLGVASVPLGLLSIVDVLTVVLGLALGVAAMTTGVLGLRELRRRPELRGRGLCLTGLSLGAVGFSLSTALGLWWWL